MTTSIKAAAILLAGAMTGFAQEPVRYVQPFVRAGGEGIVNAKPDQATVNIGVTTQATTAGAAASQNATQVAAVIERLKKEFPDLF